MYLKYSALLLAATSVLPFYGCGSSGHARSETSEVEAIENSESIPEPVKQLVKAVAENDSDGFARLVSYPLQRPYPLHDILTPEEMSAYYRELVDDSLRNVILTSGPDKWSEFGWRGWSLDDGRYIWVDENIYGINYVSHAEQQHIDSLMRVEIAAIAPSIREGWRPVMCFRDSVAGNILRVDSRSKGEDDDSNLYRLAIYAPGSDLHALPTRLLDGEMQMEGSVGLTSYRFHEGGSDANIWIIPYPGDSDTPTIIPEYGESRPLQPAYWHELIKK